VVFKDIDSPISLAFIQRYPNQGEISKCAYFIHLEEGRCDELGNWLRAERELTPVGERRFDVVAQVPGEVHLAHRGGNVGVPEQSLQAGEVLVAVVVADVGWARSATAPGR
jgi:hypothetical protein